SEPTEDESRPDPDAAIRPLVRGIHYLVAEDPDRALHELVEVARTHGAELAEVYLALGDLFRARGEYLRAVRIHQSVLARPQLDAEIRFRAHWALARDFHSGGFLDRALKQYRAVLELQPDHLPALEGMLAIHEDAGEWEAALSVLRRIGEVRGERDAAHEAFVRASLAAALPEREKAQALAEEALSVYPGCGLGWEVKLSVEPEAAAEILDQWKTHARASLPYALALAERLAPEAVEAWLQEAQDELREVEWLGWAEAAESGRARQVLKAAGFQPQTLRGWLRWSAITGESEGARWAREWRASEGNWRCAQCGLVLRELRWRCPQCRRWGTMRAIERELGCVPA
ncbi:MAG: hypothetical protein D6771_01155, partial [Zetaproteobacteria bacterium]